MTDRPTLLVSGLGRCGTSLMMQMLDAGGYPVFGSWPDYEAPIMRELPANADGWRELAEGKAIKVLDPHRWTPPGGRYLAIWLDRDLNQQVASQLKLIGEARSRQKRRAFASGLARGRTSAVATLDRIGASVLRTSFEDLISRPHPTLERIDRFLGGGFDVEAMVRQIVPRSPRNYPGLLEHELVMRAETKTAQLENLSQ